MLKVIYPCTRLPELDRAEYARRILEGHVPLALRHHPGMRHYVVNLVERDAEAGPKLDSFAQLWFDDLESYHRDLYDSEEGRRIIGEDVARFLGGADAYATREFVHRDAWPRPPGAGRTPGIKWMVWIRRRPELARDAFVARWHDVHVPLVLDALPELRRYVTNVFDQRLSETGEEWDGVSELWFESREAAREGMRRAGSAIDADSAEFLETVHAWSVAEYVNK